MEYCSDNSYQADEIVTETEELKQKVTKCVGDISCILKKLYYMNLKFDTLFRRSQYHLVRGTKLWVCNVKTCKIGFWLGENGALGVIRLRYSHHQTSGWLIKSKMIAWKPICQKIFRFDLHDQTLIFCRKNLTVKFDVNIFSQPSL